MASLDGPFPRTVAVTRGNIISNLILLVLAIISVFLRFYARKRTKSPFLQDDWLILVSLVFAVALVSTNIAAAYVWQLVKVEVTHISPNGNQAGENVFVILASAFAKLSLLFLYRRVFAVSRVSKIILFFIGLTCLWLVGFFFAFFFYKWPVACRNWPEKTCHYILSITTLCVASGVSDFIIDLAILCIPIFYLRRLQMRLEKRAAMLTIFGVGVFCIIASSARFGYSTKLDWFYTEPPLQSEADKLNYLDRQKVLQMNIWLWSGIESCTSVICASLPCYAPLVPWERWRATRHFGRRIGFWNKTTKRQDSVGKPEMQTSAVLKGDTLAPVVTVSGDGNGDAYSSMARTTVVARRESEAETTRSKSIPN